MCIVYTKKNHLCVEWRQTGNNVNKTRNLYLKLYI